jgi:hypothetical protein
MFSLYTHTLRVCDLLLQRNGREKRSRELERVVGGEGERVSDGTILIQIENIWL